MFLISVSVFCAYVCVSVKVQMRFSSDRVSLVFSVSSGVGLGLWN